MRFSLSTVFFSALIAGVSASNVLELTSADFDNHVGKGKPSFVKFYAPWCGHCKNLAPDYEKLADAFAHVKDKVNIIKVDADGKGKDVGKKHGVTGFPTLKWFDKDGKVTEYDKGRTLDELVAFIEQNAGVKSNIPPPAPSDLEVYDVYDWEQKVMESDKHLLISFTAPWCGHCKALKPIFEKIATTFKPESNCVIATINADDKKNEVIALRYGVRSYPQIKYFPASSKNILDIDDYEGPRTEEGFVKFLNEKCGAQRAVGGGLRDDAGRHQKYDELAQQFISSTADVREAIHKEAKELASSVGKLAHRYLRVMEKIANGSSDYVEKESKRLAKILAKGNMSAKKLDEIKLKTNILNSFVEKKADEVKETLNRAEAEL